MNFLTSYVDALIENQDKSIDSINGMSNDSHSNGIGFQQNELTRQIMNEANYYALASHFFWALWAIQMATSTAIKFGYMV
jgi:hypothetical protein